jgi:hypothetical protein
MDVASHHRQDDYLTALQQFNAEAFKIDDIDRLWATAIVRLNGFLQLAPVCLFIPFPSAGVYRLAMYSATGAIPDDSFSGFKPSGSFIRWLKDHDFPLSWQEICDGVLSPGLEQVEQQLLTEITAFVCFGVKDLSGSLSGVVILKRRGTSLRYTELELQWVDLMLVLLSFHLKRIQLKQACRDIQERIKTVRNQFTVIEELDATLQMFRQLAHGFNNLLTGVIGRTELALGEKDEEKIKRQVLSLGKAASGGQARVQEARDMIEATAAHISKMSDLKPKEALEQIEHLTNIICPGIDAVEERDGVERNKDPGSG